MKVSTVFFSITGNTKAMAEKIVAGLNTINGIEGKAFPIDSIDEAFLRESKAVIIGTPSYMANMSNQIKTWLETEAYKYDMAGKLVGAFATADYIHGGSEIAIQNIITHVMVLGCLPYSGGVSCGKPFIHLGPVAIAGKLDESADTFKIYGQRMAQKAQELFQ